MGAGLVVNPSAPANVPTLDLWVDFQCPACASFEESFGDQMAQMTQDNEVRLVVHVLSFLDSNLGNDSSNRAANAAFCAPTRTPSCRTTRPSSRGSRSVRARATPMARLTEFAGKAGLTGAALNTWQQCYEARAHNQYVESVQTQSAKDGINGTPTLKLNGQPLELQGLTPQSFAEQVKAATR